MPVSTEDGSIPAHETEWKCTNSLACLNLGQFTEEVNGDLLVYTLTLHSPPRLPDLGVVSLIPGHRGADRGTLSSCRAHRCSRGHPDVHVEWQEWVQEGLEQPGGVCVCVCVCVGGGGGGGVTRDQSICISIVMKCDKLAFIRSVIAIGR